MAIFSVLVLTVPPAGLSSEANGYMTKVDQREVLLRSVELFLNRDNVKQVQVAFTAEAMEESKRKFGAHLSFTGVKVFTGGPKWIDQIVAAADRIAPEVTHVVIHDGARPCVPYSDIDALLEAAEKHPAAVLAAPLRSALIETDPSGAAVATHLPSDFHQLLTPQVFSKAKFDEMCQKKAELHASELSIVKGSGLNIRIGPGDSSLCKAMLNLMPKPKVRPLSSPFEEAQW